MSVMMVATSLCLSFDNVHSVDLVGNEDGSSVLMDSLCLQNGKGQQEVDTRQTSLMKMNEQQGNPERSFQDHEGAACSFDLLLSLGRSSCRWIFEMRSILSRSFESGT